ncbi:MAG TPA: single-stranded DNA-binding protein [Jiangellales bacterium]|nr:single-stranded DNA-binding protein [Jiangellales bacterium]
MPSVADLEHRNEVQLVGRVAADPVETELPSGDRVVAVRLVVRRPEDANGRRRRAATAGPLRPAVDTLECSAWPAGLRRTVKRWEAGDVVEVSGALRRRFWRAAGGPQSRYEVELTAARRVARDGS